MSEINSGVGWYEVIHPIAATTEIVRVMEDGSIYCPEGVLTRAEFAFAAARGAAHLLMRADDPTVLARVKAEAREAALKDALAEIVKDAPPLNAELTLTPAGVVEDKGMAAYVEGVHDAWAAVNSMIIAEAADRTGADQ